jgi:hypothetical protein
LREEIIRAKLDAALTTFVTQAHGLLKNGFSEEVLVQLLARHLRIHFVSWRVDVDTYNPVEGAAPCATPQIAVRRRQAHGNFLAIDVRKVESRNSQTYCHEKLREYCLPPYFYQHAAYLEFGWVDGGPYRIVDFF